MKNPIDDLKERLEKLKATGAFADAPLQLSEDAISLVEAYREIAVHKCFLGVASPISDETIERCQSVFTSQVDTTAQQILKTSREG